MNINVLLHKCPYIWLSSVSPAPTGVIIHLSMQRIILLKQLSFWTILNLKLIYSVDIRPRQEDPTFGGPCFAPLLSGPFLLAEESVRQKNSPTCSLDTPASRPCPRPLGHWNLPSKWPKASTGLFSETKGCAGLFNGSSFQIEEYTAGIFTQVQGQPYSRYGWRLIVQTEMSTHVLMRPLRWGLVPNLRGKAFNLLPLSRMLVGFYRCSLSSWGYSLLFLFFLRRFCLIIKWMLYFVKCFFCITW